MDLDRAAPQAAKFNQGMELWLGIKRYLQEQAAQYRSRVVVFTGLIFVALDPVYRGADIPLRFFKVAAFDLSFLVLPCSNGDLRGGVLVADVQRPLQVAAGPLNMVIHGLTMVLALLTFAVFCVAARLLYQII